MRRKRESFRGLLTVAVIMLVLMSRGEVRGEGEGGQLYNPLRQYFVEPLVQQLPKLEIRGFVWNETNFYLHNSADRASQLGIRPHEFGDTIPGIGRHTPIKSDIYRSENVFEIRYKYHFTPNVTWSGQLDFLYDAVFDLDSAYDNYTNPVNLYLGQILNRPEQVARADCNQCDRKEYQFFRTFRRWFREGHLDISWGNWDIKLGKQLVVWGKATDIAQLVDRIHGLDMRELFDDSVSDDWEFTRRTSWLANISYHAWEFLDIQFIWVPDYEESIIPPETWPQSFLYPFRENSFPFFKMTVTDKPSAAFRNHEWGMRLSTLLGGYNLETYFFYYWSRIPTFFARAIDPDTGYFIIERKPTRLTLIGASAEKTFSLGRNNDWITRFEFGYTMNNYFGTKNYLSPTGELTGTGNTKKNEIQLALNTESFIGMPWGGTADWVVSFWHYSIITFGYDNDLTSLDGPLDKWFRAWSGSLAKQFYNDRATFSLSLSYLGGGNWMVTNRLDFDITDDLNVAFSYSGVSGKEHDIYGFGERVFDNVGLEINYAF